MNASRPRPQACHPLLKPLLALALSAALVPSHAQPAAPPEPPSPAEEPEAIANSGLTAPLFYQLLLGEINALSGDPGAGYSLILDAARRERDANLYRRAVEVALQARSGEAALGAARAWSQDMPDSVEAQRFVLQIVLALNRVDEAATPLRFIIERTPEAQRLETIHAIPQAFVRVSDKPRAVAVVREALSGLLRARGPQATAAWTTVGRMEIAANQLPQALVAARQAHGIEPASPFPALLALELMEKGQPDAEALVLDHLRQAPPDDVSVSLTYARVLSDLRRNGDARTLLQDLTRRIPTLAEAWLLLGTLHAQDDQTPQAREALQKYLDLTSATQDERARRGQTQAYLLLAQIAEKQKDFAGATQWLDRIDNAEDIMAVQMRRASLLARQGQLPEARALLRTQPERSPDDARTKLVAEAQLLREFKAWKEAYEVYGEAVARFPEGEELLYDQAMMAERMGQPDEMERLLRQLIDRQPDHHHAYNALGYSLADRNQRLPEAKQLIEKAVSLAPDDAYIQDSLGWVEFRLGNTARALGILQAAYRKRPDAEIAAHLGEVLWSRGQRDQATAIWREGLLLTSDNETLLETLRRFQVRP